MGLPEGWTDLDDEDESHDAIVRASTPSETP